jgi:hypothetical protein
MAGLLRSSHSELERNDTADPQFVELFVEAGFPRGQLADDLGADSDRFGAVLLVGHNAPASTESPPHDRKTGVCADAILQTVVSENPRSSRKTTEEEWSSVSRNLILILSSEFRG